MHRAEERASRPKESAKEILRLGDSQQKTRSDPSGNVGPESVSTAPNLQPYSETDSFGLSPKDSPPIPIPDNQNSSGTDNGPFKIVRQQSCQAPPDPTSNATLQSPLEQPPHRLLREQDKQGPPLLIIGAFWEQAAESLNEGDREKLNRLLERKRESEAADAPKDYKASSPTGVHEDDPPAAVSSVLSEAEKCKVKVEKATWKPVSPASP
jgi:hypothetical protein